MRFKMRITVLCLVMIIVFPLLVFARGPGTSSASFLKIDMSARPVGMGNAFCGIADDINAIQWNPGGLTQIEQQEVILTHNEWIQGIRLEFLGYAFPVDENWTLGATVNYLYVTGLVGRDINGDETGRIFGGNDGVLTLSGSRKIDKDISVGANFKIIRESVEDKSDMAYAGDIGVLYKIPKFKISGIKISGIKVGAAIQNFGTQIRLYEESFPLPLNLKIGLGYEPIEGAIFGLDVNQPIDNRVNAMVGGEYWLFDLAALRVGYKYKQDENTGIGITAGLGFKLGGWHLDYAYVPFGDLGTTHRISLNIKFGEVEK